MTSLASEPAFVGKTLAHFRVLSKLGEGGMGVVYRAEDERLRRPVALKVLPPERSADPDRRARLMREARAAAVVSHPNIAVVYEVDEAEGHVYIAMELVGGRSLRQRLEGAMPAAEVLPLVRQIAAGLARAHEAGVVHRDLKPDNVMVDDAGLVKILDFGLAKLGTPGSSGEQPTVSTVTEEGRVMGTPGYMSPEQARGGSVDARTDVFAFGVLLYELITGRRPFGGDTALDVMAAITRDAPDPPSRAQPAIPRELESLVLRCLEKDPARRPADGNALVAALDALVAAPGPTLDVKLPPRRRRWPLFAIGGAIALAAGFALWPRRAPSGAAAAGHSSAMESFRRGLTASRQAAWSHASRFFDEALDADPDLAAASLRVAINSGGVLATQREQLGRAEARRARLDEHDLALLDAERPCIADKDWSWARCEAQLQAARSRWPDDEELAYEHARMLANLGRHEESRREARATGSARGLALASAEAVQLDDVEGARQDAAACLAASPEGSGCFFALELVDQQLGDCAALERDARRWTELAGGAGLSWQMLARAQAAAGRPIADVRASLVERWRRIADSKRKEARLSDELNLALYEGDFVAADQLAGDMEVEIASWPVETEHVRLALRRVQLLSETGRSDDAAKVAAAISLERAQRIHAPGNNPVTLAIDATPLFLEAELRAGTLKRAEAARRRDAWLADWQKHLPAAWAPYLWIFGYAAPARTADEALEALAALPRFEPLPRRLAAGLGDAEIGRTYLLADRAAEAVPLLRRAVGTCRALEFPVETMRAQLDLGDALSAGGDQAGACAAYAAVLARWGAARPSSRTADAARLRRTKLACR